jgi:hypothetical protein
MSYCIGEYDLAILFILLLVNGFDVSIDSVITTHSLIHCSTLVPFHVMITKFRSNIRVFVDSPSDQQCCALLFMLLVTTSSSS